MTDAPLPYDAWIGRRVNAQADVVTPRLLDQFRATFGKQVADVSEVPPGLHWCLSPPTVAPDGLGEDGHPAKGGFLPPINLLRRMWASGDVQFLKPLNPGDVVQKSSEIKSITPKNGKSGPLCFVTIENTYTTGSDPAIVETQDIVYREAASKRASVPEPIAVEDTFDHRRRVVITPVTLFRYSALTFNAHRIHYDLSYTQSTEFYPDLVIHGPLQATLLLNFAASLKTTLPKRFSFKGVAPATGTQTLQLEAKATRIGFGLSVYTANGVKTMQAVAEW